MILFSGNVILFSKIVSLLRYADILLIKNAMELLIMSFYSLKVWLYSCKLSSSSGERCSSWRVMLFRKVTFVRHVTNSILMMSTVVVKMPWYYSHVSIRITYDKCISIQRQAWYYYNQFVILVQSEWGTIQCHGWYYYI